MHHDEKGVYLSYWSRYAPFGADGPKEKCASVELMLAPGEDPVNVYRIVFLASGEVEDWRRQIDPPRAPDPNYEAKGVRFESKSDDVGRLWTFEAFVPWSAFDEGLPKPGAKWRMNILRTNPSGDGRYGTASLTPTLGDRWRTDLYGVVTFE